MNENAITIISPKTLAEAKELAAQLSGARTIPEALQKSPADVLAIVMAGAELGLAPMQSLRALVIIKGKPTLSADAMGALVKSRRDVCQYLQLKTSTDKVATYATQRVGEPEPTVLSFTIEEAKQAGLVAQTRNGEPNNWMRFPAAMLRARALSAICRAVYQDLLLGVYDPEELAPERIEKDVTPSITTSPVTTEDLKAEIKHRKMMILEDTKPTPPQPPKADDPDLVGWGKNGHLRLDSLTPSQLEWYRVDATAKVEKAKTDDERDLWLSRKGRYEAALQSARVVSATEEAAAS